MLSPVPSTELRDCSLDLSIARAKVRTSRNGLADMVNDMRVHFLGERDTNGASNLDENSSCSLNT